jgi:hypothetical protein
VHSSAKRRRAAAPTPSRGRRLLAIVAGLVVAGGSIAVAQFASAEDNGTAACADTAQAGTLRAGDGDRRRPRGGHNHGQPSPTGGTAPVEETTAPENPDDPGTPPGSAAPEEPAPQDPAPEEPADPGTPPEECEEGEEGEGGEDAPAPPPNNGLEVLGRDCEGSDLQAHTGFQDGLRCVNTEMGEVGEAARNPSLLITRFPQRVGVNQAFQIRVSTRNLVRDRFLGAAAGGYYLESSFLNDAQLQRGHIHTACRMLADPRVAPDPAPVPEFFRATEDGGGGDTPDQVTIDVTGMPRAGIAQCTVWAGDGSHRAPMMQRANQTPAVDSVRIIVGRRR